MPLLGRFFARKNKVAPRPEILDDDNAHSPTFAPTTESHESSNTMSSYVTPDISVPSHPNANNLQRFTASHSASVASSGGGLRLFRRKKSITPSTHLSNSSNLNNRSELDTPQRSAPPRPSVVSTDPTDFRRLRPPPSRSAIFAAYADPGSSLSTRSLPESTLSSASPLLSPSPSPAPPPKRPSLFAWAKPSSRSSSNTGSNLDVSLGAPGEYLDLPPDWHSFNLKSFRHIGSASPPPLPNQRDVSVCPSIPRPRGASVHSDLSQRISVAAFREAQARRSQTGSPVPSPVESSPKTLPRSEGPRPSNGPRTSRSSAALLQSSRQSRTSIALVSTTDEDNSSSESDSDGESIYKGKKPHQRPGRRARSELGHGLIVTETSFKRTNALAQAPRTSRSHAGHGSNSNSRPVTSYEPDLRRPELPRRSQSSLGLYEGSNKPARSASTASLNTPVVGHKRDTSISSDVTRSTARKVTPPQASSQQPARAKVAVEPPPRDSDSDSEDNAPLASLMAPKRPGSATSSYSNPRSVSGLTNRSAGPVKPLIDVNEVISSKPISVSSPPSDSAFTQGPTLLSAAAMTAPILHGPSPLASNPKSGDHDSQPSTRKVSPVKSPSSPAKEVKELVGCSPGPEVPNIAFVSRQRESSQEQQKRDPLSDRLSRAVKKSLTNPANPGLTSPPTITKPLDGPINRLSVATSSESLQTRQSYEAARVALPRSPPPIIQPSKDEYSPPDEDLAELLGSAGIKLISRMGEPEETSSSESSEEETQKGENTIAPIPIKQRTPPPAFAVTSRPALPKQGEQNSKSSALDAKNLPGQIEGKTPGVPRPSEYPTERQRNSTVVPSSSSSSFPSTNASPSIRNSKVSSHLTSPSATDVSTKSTNSNGRAGALPKGDKITNVRHGLDVGQKSTTMISGLPLPSQMPRHVNTPDRPFATVRGNSTASSTGDSSSGRAPHTPRDSIEICVPEARVQKPISSTTKADEWNRGAAGMSIKRQNAHVKRRSVSFEDDICDLTSKPSGSHLREGAIAGSNTIAKGGSHVRESARAGPESDEEQRKKEKEKEKEKEGKRKERRRQEAQAAIELGNVMHGPPPVLDDDNNDLPTNPTMNPRLSAFNPMMVMNPMAYTPPPGGWVPSMAQPMLSPAQFMIPQPSDSNLMAAHQQAMMVAKQAYQMAVAQQAMAAAAEEWERGSALGGFGSRASVYGSTAPSMMNAPPGMMPGMGMMSGMQGNPAGVMWPGSPSLYGGMGTVPRFGSYLSPGDAPFSSSRSDHGQGTGTRASGNWSTSKSTYGEFFGPQNDSFLRQAAAMQQHSIRQQTWSTGHDLMYIPPVPPIPASKNMTGSGSPEPRGPSRLRTVSQPATPTRSALARKVPPSSWRPGS